MNNLISNVLNAERPKMDSGLVILKEDKSENSDFDNILNEKILDAQELEDNTHQKNNEFVDEYEVEISDVKQKQDEIKLKRSEADTSVKKKDKADTENTEKLTSADLLKKISSLLHIIKNIDIELFRKMEKELKTLKSDLNVAKWKDMNNLKTFNRLVSLWNALKNVLQKHTSLVSKPDIKKDLREPDNPKLDNEQKQKGKVKEDISLLKNKNEVNILKNRKVIISKVPSEINHLLNDKKVSVNSKTSSILNNVFENQVKDLQHNQMRETVPVRKVNVNELIDQIARQVRITLNNNKSEVVMNLKPEFLGKMFIKLDFKDNVLSGKFIVENLQAEKMLKDNLSALKVTFQNMGMEVQEFDISMNKNYNFDHYSEDIYSDIKDNRSSQSFFNDDEEILVSEVEIPLYYDGYRARNVNIRI